MYSRAFRTSGGSAFCFSSMIWLISAESCSAKNASSRTVAPYLSFGMIGVVSQALRMPPVNGTPHSRDLAAARVLSDWMAERRKTCPIRRKPIVFFAESHRHRRLGQAERAGLGAGLCQLSDNFGMRLQTDGQRLERCASRAQNRFSFVFW